MVRFLTKYVHFGGVTIYICASDIANILRIGKNERINIKAKLSTFLTAVIILLFACVSNAEVRKDDGFQWNVEIAVAIISDPSNLVGAEQKETSDYFGGSLIVDLYYKGFFIESNRHRLNYQLQSSDFGYELVSEDTYDIDLLARSYINSFDENNAGVIFEELNEELEGIEVRDAYLLQGIRYTGYRNNDVYWFSVGVDILDGVHHGWVLDGFYTSTYHLRNWDLQLGAGATLFSANMNQYYFGIEQGESSESRPIYTPSTGYRGEFEISGRYPVNEHWLLTTGLTLSHYSKSIDDSPITARQNVLRYVLSVSYVF